MEHCVSRHRSGLQVRFRILDSGINTKDGEVICYISIKCPTIYFFFETFKFSENCWDFPNFYKHRNFTYFPIFPRIFWIFANLFRFFINFLNRKISTNFFLKNFLIIYKYKEFFKNFQFCMNFSIFRFCMIFYPFPQRCKRNQWFRCFFEILCKREKRMLKMTWRYSIEGCKSLDTKLKMIIENFVEFIIFPKL